jgi:hypothetical protein
VNEPNSAAGDVESVCFISPGIMAAHFCPLSPHPNRRSEIAGAIAGRYHFHVHDLLEQFDAGLSHTLCTPFFTPDVLLGHDTADDLAQELVAGAGARWAQGAA